MKHWLSLLLLAMLPSALRSQQATDSAWRADVKSVLLYSGATGDDPRAALPVPVLTLGENARLTLEFDILGTQPEELRWSVRHCSRFWYPDSLLPEEYLSGFAEGSVEDYDFSFTTLTSYVHYRCVLPDRFASFSHSGNYLLSVLAPDNSVLLTRRFCVSEQSVPVKMQCTRPYDGIDIDRRQEVDLAVESRQRPEYLTAVLQQNGRLDNLRVLQFSGYDGSALAYGHRQENIFYAGNTFRFFDCSNLRSPMYNVARIETYGGETFAMLRPDEDRSRKHYLSETTLNGGMKINVWDRNNPRLEADYVWVNITLPAAQPFLDGKVYVVGALTDWKLDSTALMDYNPQLRAYTKRLLLKQGYYAYQLLFVGGGFSPLHSKTARLEGDHRETPNRYTAYLYLRTPADRADRLVAVHSVVGR